MNIEGYYLKSVGFSPNPLQRAVWEAYWRDEHPALLVRAGTGTGKTEAALLPALADERRVIMVLPSKALIEDMGQRVREIGKDLCCHDERGLAITVDMGGSCWRYVCQREQIEEPKQDKGRQLSLWESHPLYKGKVEEQTYHRHLFADDIIVTTLDKFLFRLFGYGEKIKSYIFPHRVFGSTLGKQPFIIFDEAHDYEGLAFSNFIKLLETLYVKGKDLCVMSATLPDEFVNFLKVIDAQKEPLFSEQQSFQKERLGMIHPGKNLYVVPAPNTSPLKRNDFLEVMVEETTSRYHPAKRVIVRMEWVGNLIQLYERLKPFNPFVYHGRLTSRQRRSVIQNLISRQQKDEGFLVLATSAIEAGSDLDSHYIITELCNPDSLVQLAGRLNRRCKMIDAELVVVGNGIHPRICSIDRDRLDEYMKDLHSMGNQFNATLLEKYFRPAKGDWMGEILFTMLWEYVYEGDLTSKPLWDRGILVTRSWEPSVVLCTGIDDNNRPVNPIQTGINRLAVSMNKPLEELKNENVSDWFHVGENGEWHAELKRAYFHPGRWEESHWAIYPFPSYRISAYEANLICVIKEKYTGSYYDDTLGYKNIPKILLKSYKKGFERVFQYHPQMKKDGKFSLEGNYVKDSGSLWFLER
jgi:CRISPR-associated endonuclease/helicase Cas3